MIIDNYVTTITFMMQQPFAASSFMHDHTDPLVEYHVQSRNRHQCEENLMYNHYLARDHATVKNLVAHFLATSEFYTCLCSYIDLLYKGWMFSIVSYLVDATN